jgi:membrane protein YqaA with SNARE-associated domain
MKFFYPLLHFLFHIGYFGPFLMGILDSSFLFLPFGNDLLVVGLVASHHQGLPWYVLSAACGSTVGAFLLALVSRKLGEEGIRRMSGDAKYEKLKRRIGSRSGIAVAVAGLAPPPFPFTTAIAAVSALGYPFWKTLLINFLARGTRFVILGFLALKFGRQVLSIAKSPAFEWSMVAFVVLCIIASAFSVVHWFRKPQGRSPSPQAAD